MEKSFITIVYELGDDDVIEIRVDVVPCIKAYFAKKFQISKEVVEAMINQEWINIVDGHDKPEDFYDDEFSNFIYDYFEDDVLDIIRDKTGYNFKSISDYEEWVNNPNWMED